jgi:hypothetical protein
MDISGLDELDVRELRFNDTGGTHVFTITDDGSDNIVLESKESDKDIVFKGNVNNVAGVTLLTLDTSETKAVFDGNVNVESSDSTTNLTIKNTATGGDPQLGFALSTDNTFTMGVDDSDGDKLKIGTTAIGTNTRMTIDSSGNVGIGTDSPVEILTVGGTITTTKNQFLGFNAYHSGGWKSYETGSVAILKHDEATNSFQIRQGSSSETKDVAFTPTIPFCVRSGKVGIGATNPSKDLHIQTSNQRQIRIEQSSTNRWDVDVRGSGLHFYYQDSTSVYIRFNTNGTVTESSDDRIKVNEEYITGASTTLMKLKPQKYNIFDNDITYPTKTSGLIAQDVYYDCPELRHLISVPEDAVPGDKPVTPEDPTQDPDYSNWGSTSAGINYTGLIAYIIKMNQEQQELINTQQTTITNLTSRIEALENP